MRTPLILGFGLLTACTGIVGNNGGDDDDTPPPPPVTTVQIKVHDGATAQANVHVIFADPSDIVVSDTMTGADGSATAELPNGGNLTVIRTYTPLKPGDPLIPSEVYTYVGVKAGDVLELGKMSDALATPSAINVILPTTTTGNANIITQCGRGQGAAPNVPITVKGCDAMVDFYVTDGDQASFFKQSPYGSNADLSGEQLQGALGATITATNTDPNTTINAEIRIVAGNYQLDSSGVKRIDQNPADVNLPNVIGLDQLVVAAIAPQAGGTQMVATRSAYFASPVTVDATNGIIPYVTTPMYTPTAVTWTETGPGTADFVLAMLTVTDPANPSDPGYIRAVVAPHTGLTLTLPQLQGAAAIYNPTMTDQIDGAQGIAAVTGGYDAARAHIFTLSSAIQLAPLGGTATLSYSGTAPEVAQPQQ